MHKVKYFAINIGLVYFLEYSCITGFADRVNPLKDHEDDGFIRKNV